MSRIVSRLMLVVMLGVMAGAIGCGEQQEEMTTEPQPDMAADRIQQLQALYDQEQQARIAAEEDANRLRTQVDQLRSELASCQEETSGDWKGLPGGAMISIEGVVLFDSGKAELKSSGKAKLNEIASTIQSQFAGHEIYVFGHTDNDPIRKSSWKDNYELSCQRALSVVRYLQSRGVSSYLAACGWGQHRPVTANDSATAKQRNRRVEIFAKGDQPALSRGEAP